MAMQFWKYWVSGEGTLDNFEYEDGEQVPTHLPGLSNVIKKVVACLLLKCSLRRQIQKYVTGGVLNLRAEQKIVTWMADIVSKFSKL